MRKVVFLMVLFFGLTISSSVFAANWKNVTFVNHTGRTIYRLYFTSSGYGTWGDDYLGASTLKNGSSKELRYNADTTFFDFKIDFDSNGKDYLYWLRYNFSNVWRITIYPNGSGGYKAVKN